MSIVSVDSPQALLFVYGECGADVAEEEFHDWYDNEHAPARLTVKGVTTARRYKTTDNTQPSWLAVYDLASPDVMTSDEYKSLFPNASDRERDIISRVKTLNRRVYSLISSFADPSKTRPAKYLLCISQDVTPEGEEEYNKWYEEEHLAHAQNLPGLVSARRYKLLEGSQTELGGKADKANPMKILKYLSLHEFETPNFRTPESEKIVQTPRFQEVQKFIIAREIRVFELYKDFGGPK